MWQRLSFRAKLLATYLVLVLAAAATTFVVLDRQLEADLIDTLQQRVRDQVAAAGEWVRVAGRPERLATKLGHVVSARVVIMSVAGQVLGDSAPDGGALAGAAEDAGRALRAGLIEGRRRDATGAIYQTACVAVDVDRVVCLAAPLAPIEATRRRLEHRLLLVTGISVLVALGLGVVAVQVVARPLRRMVASAERLARGDFAIDPPLGSSDELGVLSRSLDSLARQVSDRIADLERERDFLGAVIAALVEGVAVVDREGAIVLCNASAERLLGRRKGDALGPPLAAPVAEALAGTELLGRELEHAGRVLIASAMPLKTPHGGAVLVVHDVSDLRRLETVRRDFVANLSHELRTPVTSIRGYAETLAAGVRDDATRDEFVATIQRNAIRLGRLVDDLLQLQALDARPAGAPASEPIDLAAVVAAVVRTIQPAASRAGCAIAVDVAPATLVLGDADGLEQVVQNLLDNAVKYGGGAVRVSASRRGDAAEIELAIADDGPGIPPEAQARVFERFFRVDAGRARAQGGSGLGLAIVKHQCEVMGARIAVDGSVARGARFVVTLRAAPASS